MTQTKRHSFIVSLLGIKHVLIAVNKMDLVDWSEDRFEEIKSASTATSPLGSTCRTSTSSRSAHLTATT